MDRLVSIEPRASGDRLFAACHDDRPDACIDARHWPMLARRHIDIVVPRHVGPKLGEFCGLFGCWFGLGEYLLKASRFAKSFGSQTLYFVSEAFGVAGKFASNRVRGDKSVDLIIVKTGAN